MITLFGISSFIAWRFVRGTQESSIRLMMRICFFGIAIGTFALTLVAAVMNGFEKATHQKLQGINSDIIIRSNGKPIDYDKVASVLTKEYNSSLEASSPQAINHLLITTKNTTEPSMPNVAGIIGIDPLKQGVISTLEKTLIKPADATLSSILQPSHILIGEQLANLLGIRVGDQVSLLFVTDEEPVDDSIMLSRSSATVGGIFKTGIDEYDTNMIFCSLDYFSELFPRTGITSIGLKLRPGVSPSIIRSLQDRFSTLQVISWKDLYLPLVAALALEKYAMFLILILITLVASMSIVSLLFMMVTHKQPDIAILATMGMSHRAIACIFIIIGMGITMAATLTGILLAAIASWFLNTYPLIKLPDVYYVTHLPASLPWSLVATVIAITLFLSFCATWFPAQRIRKLSLSTIFKN